MTFVHPDSVLRVLALVATAASLGLAAPAPAAAQDADTPPAAPTEAAAPPTIGEAQRIMQGGDFAGAVTAFRQIVEANPDHAQAWFLLGYSLHAQGRLTEALPCHLMAAEFTESNQTRPTAMYNIACVYSLRGKADKAFEWLDRARDAGFRNPSQLQNDTDMDNLRADPRFEMYMRSLTAGGGGPTTSARPDEIAKLPPRRQFDFWVGDWNVFVPSGEPAGENHIEIALGGNLLMERWQSARGGTGRSVNYFDAGAGEWVQVWVDQEGESIVMRGGFKDGAMRLQGTRTLPSGEVSLIRGAWSPMSAGRVRQFIEESKDDGTTWSTWFDGTYVRR